MVDFKSIDDRTNLAGTNRLEILMFKLQDNSGSDGSPLYGINVFKVRELMVLPELIQGPNSAPSVAGIANIRGKAVPVIDLHHYFGYSDDNKSNILIVTEFNGSTQGFLVEEVDDIIQLAWSDIREPPEIVTEMAGEAHGSTLTAMSQLDEQRMLLIIDVEQVIAEVLGTSIDVIDATEMPHHNEGAMVFFADDSRVARAQVGRILDKMGIRHQSAKNGQEALEALRVLADAADEKNQPLSDSVRAIITDVEMPKMDGYVLTSKIKADARFNGIPVMMHSSLSTSENKRLGMKVGADAYIPKLRPQEFSQTLDGLLNPPLKDAG